MRKGGETAKAEGKTAYRKLVKATRATIQQAQQVLPALRAIATKKTERLAATLETFIPRAEQVVNQAVR
jgi:hypothetical protein